MSPTQVNSGPVRVNASLKGVSTSPAQFNMSLIPFNTILTQAKTSQTLVNASPA